MPELPDVEVFKRYLDATSLHRRIERVRVPDPSILKSISPSALQRRLKSKEFAGTRRHGKHLFVQLTDDGWLVLHFGMTGFLRYGKGREKAPAHVRLAMDFSNGYTLFYDNQRRLGQVSLIDDPGQFVQREKLGPDALKDLDADGFKDAVSGARGSVKSALMSQKRLAGLGNIYSDEILFQSGIHPRTKVGDLGEGGLDKVFRSMRRVLEAAIEARADPQKLPQDFLIPHRQKDGRCPKCGAEIQKVKCSGRTAYVCPECQSISADAGDGAG